MEPGWEEEHRVDCGWLRVPESRQRPGGRSLSLWVAIARADEGSERREPLLYIHGGPGIGTVDTRFPSFTEHPTWPRLRARRDLVFFDQRGTGRSRPEICSDLDETLDALSVEDPPARVALDRAVAAFSTCRARLLAEGMDFAAYNSRATAADAEDLRRALGYPAWNVYGVSYGTWVAMELMRSHPGGLRSVILDSPYPPNSPFWAE